MKEFVSKQGQKQRFAPVQPAKGKSATEGIDSRYQMDLADLTSSPVSRGEKVYKFFLVLVNVFDRKVYAKALKSKTPQEVVAKLSQILGSRLRPTVISSDNGSEFTGPVSDYLTSKRITQRFKAVNDVNGIAVVDAAIKQLKQKLATMMAANPEGTWVDKLPKAVEALNNQPKNEVLHGASPNDVKETPEIQFQLMQDNARKFQANKELNQQRVRKLQETEAFRAPLPESVSKFKRGFQATYGDVQKVAGIRGSTVTAQDGRSIDIKQIKVVPADSSTAQQRFGTNDRLGEDKRRKGGPILAALRQLLRAHEKDEMSLSRAAQLLREDLARDGQDYEAILARAKAKLVDLVRLEPQMFKLVNRPGVGGTEYLHVSLVER